MTLAEVLIALAILALLAAVLYPTIMAQLTRGQSAALANQLGIFRDAVHQYRENVGRFPNTLVQLTTQPTAGALDICGAAVPAGLLSRWRGPYLNQAVVPDSVKVGDATVLTQLFRNPANTAAGQTGMLWIVGYNVDSAAAVDLEAHFDGNADFAVGNFLWVPTFIGLPNFFFLQVPIRGC